MKYFHDDLGAFVPVGALLFPFDAQTYAVKADGSRLCAGCDDLQRPGDDGEWVHVVSGSTACGAHLVCMLAESDVRAGRDCSHHLHEQILPGGAA